MKIKWKLILGLFVFISLVPISVKGLKNPSAVYCEELGYNYTTVQTEAGELGLCKLPDGSTVKAWNFLKGKTHTKHSYCSQKGYEIKTISDSDKCSSISSNKCAVCILDNGTEVEVTNLMGLNFEEGICGDGVCVLGETYENCPSDCDSGSLDMYCDKVKDGICDPDCSVDEDPDCTKETTTTSSTTSTTSTEPKLKCGNGICEKDENQKNCPEDCKTKFPYYILWVVIAIVIVIVSTMIIFESKKTSEENYE